MEIYQIWDNVRFAHLDLNQNKPVLYATVNMVTHQQMVMDMLSTTASNVQLCQSQLRTVKT